MQLASRITDTVMNQLAELAVAAGHVVMRHYGKVAPTAKADGSPVTLADQQAEALILAELATILPGAVVLAEEDCAARGASEVGPEFVTVDALDGTKEFIHQQTDFTVNIGLVSAGQPVAGVVYAPALARLWVGWRDAWTAEVAPGAPLATMTGRRAIAVRPMPGSGLVAVASRRHTTPESDAFLASLPIGDRQTAGSSLKFCLVAEGIADVYPRFSPTMEWDTAAGHALVQAAGGGVMTEAGGPLIYGKYASGYRNPGFVVAGDLAKLRRLLHPS